MNADETSRAAVLQEISGILEKVREEYALADAVELTMETRFQDDLELESIDLVELAGHLNARYGSHVNFAEFLADLELDEIIELTVGRLVDYVVGCLGQSDPQGAAVATANGEH